MTPQDLLAKQAITEQIIRYCRALNRCDKELMCSVFHDDATYEHGPYKGAFTEFSVYALELLEKLDSTHHQVGNILIDLIDEDHALTEAYWSAYHRIGAHLETPAFPDHTLGTAENVLMGGRYVDHFEKRNGQWKIAQRYDIYEWARWEEASDRGFTDAPASGRGAHIPDDRSYHIVVGADSYALLHRGKTLKGV